MGYKHAPYSYSKFNLFERCPFAWKLHYIEKIPEVKTPALIIGDLVHRSIAEYMTHLKKTGCQTDLEKLSELTRKYGRLSGQYSDEYEAYIPAMRELTLPPVEKTAIEVDVAADADWRGCDFWAEDAFLRGKVDFMYQPSEETVVIVDWKTNRYIPPEAIERDKQTKLYALLGSLLVPDAAEFVVELFYLRYSYPRRATMTRGDLEETREWVLETVDKIESEQEWPPTPGAHCDWCSYVSRCPAAKRALGEAEDLVLPPAIETDRQAKELTELYKMLGVVRDRVGQLLKTWIEAHGGVEIAGEKLDLYPVESIQWSTPEQKGKLVTVLRQGGIAREAIWDVFSTNKTAVTSFLRREKRKKLLKEALATGERTVSVRFNFKKL